MTTIASEFNGYATGENLQSGLSREHANGHVKVSIIIPVYNAERYLSETLDSTLAQTLSDIEIICIDDNSTDNSFGLLQMYAKRDSRITLIKHDVNRGAGAAINDGLKTARGEFFQLLGNDDTLPPDAMQRLYEYCTRSEIDMCLYGTDVFCDDPGNEELAQRTLDKARYHNVESDYPIMSGVDLLKKMVENKEYRMTNGPIFTHASLFSEETLNVEGYRHEDMAYTYKLLVRAKRATLIPDKYYRYRIRSGSQEAVTSKSTHSYEEIASKLVNAHEMLMHTPASLLEDDAFYPVVSSLVNKHLRRAALLFEAASKAERKKVLRSADWRVRLFSAHLTLCRQHKDKLDELEHIQG